MALVGHLLLTYLIGMRYEVYLRHRGSRCRGPRCLAPGHFRSIIIFVNSYNVLFNIFGSLWSEQPVVLVAQLYGLHSQSSPGDEQLTAPEGLNTLLSLSWGANLQRSLSIDACTCS